MIQGYRELENDSLTFLTPVGLMFDVPTPLRHSGLDALTNLLTTEYLGKPMCDNAQYTPKSP